MNQLRTTRKEMGLTQVEAANICGVSRRTYQTYEDGKFDTSKFDELIELLERNHQAYRKRIVSVLSIKLTCMEVFAKYPEVKCAYLYGSYARKEATGDSDIDILVVCHGMGLKFFRMVGELEEQFEKEVDVQTSDQIADSPKLIENILVDGIKIYG